MGKGGRGDENGESEGGVTGEGSELACGDLEYWLNGYQERMRREGRRRRGRGRAARRVGKSKGRVGLLPDRCKDVLG